MRKISIIIPVYNSKDFLESCVESIIDQAYENLEIIMIDDGSTDGGGTLCDKLAQKDSRILVVHKANAGVSKARNDGIQRASGEYILFVDSDDRLTKDALSTLSPCINCDTPKDVIIFGHEIHRSETVSCTSCEKGIFEKSDFQAAYVSLYQKYMIHSPCNKVYSKQLIQKNKLRFPENMSLGEDLMFNNSYLRCCESFCVLEDSLYIYECRETESLTTRFHDNLFAIYREHYQDTLMTMQHFGNISVADEVRLKAMFCYHIKQAINILFHPQSPYSLESKYSQLKTVVNSDLTGSCIRHDPRRDLYHYLVEYRLSFPLFAYIQGSKYKGNITKRIIGLSGTGSAWRNKGLF